MKTERLFYVRGLATLITGGARGIRLTYREAMADNDATVIIMDMAASSLPSPTSTAIMWLGLFEFRPLSVAIAR